MHRMPVDVAELPLIPLSIDKLRPLRSEQHAELKNALMMERLSRKPWFVKYRAQLADYRLGKGPRPQYPTEEVEAVEREVDQWIVENEDPFYTR